jgi:hypothetical protein
VQSLLCLVSTLRAPTHGSPFSGRSQKAASIHGIDAEAAGSNLAQRLPADALGDTKSLSALQRRHDVGPLGRTRGSGDPNRLLVMQGLNYIAAPMPHIRKWPRLRTTPAT